MARHQDGPYSDIEIFCVIATPEVDIDYEWIYGPGKAEINILGRETARLKAREVDEFWAISQGRFLEARLVFGDPACLQELKELVLALSEAEIQAVVRQVIIGELYEWIGKVRNAARRKHYAPLALWAGKFTEMVALLLGLVRRTCYTTGSRLLEESRQFDDLPAGYPRLCDLVQRGDLSDASATIEALEATWAGLAAWTEQRDIRVPVAAWPFPGSDPAGL
jgi:kanamycin nucleotidyltransferase